MKDWFSFLKPWWKRKHDLEYLARVRAEGQTRYIIQCTLTMGLVMMLASDFVGDLTMWAAIQGHLTGLLMGWLNWHQIENSYQAALNEARRKGTVTAGPSNILGLRDS